MENIISLEENLEDKNINTLLEEFINSSTSSSLALKDNNNILAGAIYNDSSKKITKWDELIQWQTEWKKKLKTNYYIYFGELPKNASLTMKKNYNKQKLIIMRKFKSFGSVLIPVFNNDVNLVITNDFNNLNNEIIIRYQNQNNEENLKIWDFNKTTRFFKRFEINVSQMIDKENDEISERDPNVTYFNDDPHIYLYDIRQSYKPLICKRWERSELNKMSKQLPFPTLSIGTYGKCPFERKTSLLENHSRNNMIRKKYFRDELNKKYALKLKRFYNSLNSLQSNINQINSSKFFEAENTISLSHDCLDTKKVFDRIEKVKLKRTNTNFKFMSFNENDKETQYLNDISNDFMNEELIKIDEEEEEEYNTSSQDTLETETGSDNRFSSLGDFETRTDLLTNLNASFSVSVPLMISNNYPRTKYNNLFCENCKEHFESLLHHISTENHITFANNCSNYCNIDNLILKLHNK